MGDLSSADGPKIPNGRPDRRRGHQRPREPGEIERRKLSGPDELMKQFTNFRRAHDGVPIGGQHIIDPQKKLLDSLVEFNLEAAQAAARQRAADTLGRPEETSETLPTRMAMPADAPEISRLYNRCTIKRKVFEDLAGKSRSRSEDEKGRKMSRIEENELLKELLRGEFDPVLEKEWLRMINTEGLLVIGDPIVAVVSYTFVDLPYPSFVEAEKHIKEEIRASRKGEIRGILDEIEGDPFYVEEGEMLAAIRADNFRKVLVVKNMFIERDTQERARYIKELLRGIARHEQSAHSRHDLSEDFQVISADNLDQWTVLIRMDEYLNAWQDGMDYGDAPPNFRHIVHDRRTADALYQMGAKSLGMETRYIQEILYEAESPSKLHVTEDGNTITVLRRHIYKYLNLGEIDRQTNRETIERTYSAEERTPEALNALREEPSSFLSENPVLVERLIYYLERCETSPRECPEDMALFFLCISLAIQQLRTIKEGEFQIMDLGMGRGGPSLLQFSDRFVKSIIGIERNALAHHQCMENASAMGIPSGDVHFVNADFSSLGLLSLFKKNLDLLVANPPYLAIDTDNPDFPDSVKGGEDGTLYVPSLVLEAGAQTRAPVLVTTFTSVSNPHKIIGEISRDPNYNLAHYVILKCPYGKFNTEMDEKGMHPISAVSHEDEDGNHWQLMVGMVLKKKELMGQGRQPSLLGPLRNVINHFSETGLPYDPDAEQTQHMEHFELSAEGMKRLRTAFYPGEDSSK